VKMKSMTTQSMGDEAGTLKGQLTLLHQKLISMPANITTDWHVALDNYVLTAANLYISMASPPGGKPR